MRPQNAAMGELTRPLIGFTALTARGWTPSMIERFLGNPDSTPINPKQKSRMKFWSRDRILKAEATTEFAQTKQAASDRRQKVNTGIKRKQEELIARAETLPITVHEITPEELRAKACIAYNQREESIEDPRGSRAIAGRCSREDFLLHLECNYVRHNLTVYDDHFDKSFGRIGLNVACQIIRRRVYEAIAETYPHLRGECARQLAPNQQGHRFPERPWRSK